MLLAGRWNVRTCAHEPHYLAEKFRIRAYANIRRAVGRYYASMYSSTIMYNVHRPTVLFTTQKSENVAGSSTAAVAVALGPNADVNVCIVCLCACPKLLELECDYPDDDDDNDRIGPIICDDDAVDDADNDHVDGHGLVWLNTLVDVIPPVHPIPSSSSLCADSVYVPPPPPPPAPPPSFAAKVLVSRL